MKLRFAFLLAFLLLGRTPATLAAEESLLPEGSAPPGPGVVPPATADSIELATRAYAGGERARVIETPAYVLYPYGQVQPRLDCAPLRVCIVELQAGETVLATVAGDTERWTIQPTFAGARGDIPILAVKPQSCDATTNLVVLTSKRIYDLELNSPPCRGADRGESVNPRLAYTRRIRFYYPDDLVQEWAREDRAARDREVADRNGRLPLSLPVSLEVLNFSYRWRKDRGYPWTPEQVFDDAAHVYIKLPRSARKHEAPLLFLLRDGEATDLLNYAVRGDYYVTDRTFERAVLVVGAGRKRHQLTIENRAWGGR